MRKLEITRSLAIASGLVALLATLFTAAYGQSPTSVEFERVQVGSDPLLSNLLWSTDSKGLAAYQAGGAQDFGPLGGLQTSNTSGNLIPIYLLADYSNGDHLFTTSWTEVLNAEPAYTFEYNDGYVFPADGPWEQPLYRSYNPYSNTHYYSTSAVEMTYNPPYQSTFQFPIGFLAVPHDFSAMNYQPTQPVGFEHPIALPAETELANADYPNTVTANQPDYLGYSGSYAVAKSLTVPAGLPPNASIYYDIWATGGAEAYIADVSLPMVSIGVPQPTVYGAINTVGPWGGLAPAHLYGKLRLSNITGLKAGDRLALLIPISTYYQAYGASSVNTNQFEIWSQ